MDTVIQIGLLEAIADLLLIQPIFLTGLAFISILLVVTFRKGSHIPRVRTTVASLLMYYYLCILFINVVGIPTLKECIRMSQLGEGLFHPIVNLIPFSDGISLSFILNIFLFIPLGFLCPFISRTFERARTALLIGICLSVVIEISQLFTLYRATDVDDLLTNTIGTVIGYLCFRLAVKFKIAALYSHQNIEEKDATAYLPIIIVVAAFVFSFFS